MESFESEEEIQKYEKFLNSHGYRLDSTQNNIFRIVRNQPVSRVIILLIFLLGLGIVGASIIIAEYRILLLGFMMMLFPLINKGWKYPLAIVFDMAEKFLTIEKGVLFKSYKLYPIDEIDEISVHRVSKATEVNPFTDGSKEHVYIYSLTQNEQSQQLMRLVSRKNIDKNAKTFSSYLNRLIK